MLRPCLQELLELAPSLIGRRVSIRESISRSRDVGGHDRHFATSSQLTLQVRTTDTALSGAQLQFDDGAQTWYGVALAAVVEVQYEEGQQLRIVEQFETRTERLTVITILECGDRGPLAPQSGGPGRYAAGHSNAVEAELFSALRRRIGNLQVRGCASLPVAPSALLLAGQQQRDHFGNPRLAGFRPLGALDPA